MIDQKINYDKNQPLVSVIIPIYKVEQYLCECIDSIIFQSYKNLEIILVDDGSPDNCPQICNEYAKKDSRILVIHKKNGGLSDARNKGIELSTGSWILYVDSDDWLERNAIENLIGCTINNNVDIVVGVAKEIAINGNIKFQKHSNLESGKIYPSNVFIEKSIKKGEWYAPAWLNLYRSEFIKDNNLYFVKNLLYEDMEILPRVFLSAQSIYYYDNPFYNYRIREDSIMTNTKLELSQKSSKYIIEEWFNIFTTINDNELRNMLFYWYIKIFLFLCTKYKILNKSYVEEPKLIFLLKYSRNIKLFIKGLIFKISRKLYFKIYCLYQKK